MVGGDPGSADLTTAKLNIFLSALYNAAEELNLTVNIVSQKLMENNKATDESIYQYIYNKIMYKTNILCHQYFGGPLHEDELKGVSAHFFKNVQIKYTSSIRAMTNLLSMAQVVYDTHDPEFEHAFMSLSRINNYYRDRAQFLAAIKAMFSVQGFKDLCLAYEPWYTRSSELIDFVFDIKTKKIHVINENHYTPSESVRNLYLLDRNNGYHLCFDGQLGEWHVPTLTAQYFRRCSRAVNLVVDNRGSLEALAHAFNTNSTDVMDIGCLLRSAREMFGELQSNPIPLKTQLSAFNTRPIFYSYFFKSAAELASLYQSDSVECPQLIRLKELTNLDFKAKVRIHPTYAVDAHYESPSLADAYVLKELLHTKNIIAHVVAISVVVPAINVAQHANAISLRK